MRDGAIHYKLYLLKLTMDVHINLLCMCFCTAAVATRSRADCSGMEDRRRNKRPYQPKHSPSCTRSSILHNDGTGLVFYSCIPPPSHGGPFKCYVMQWGVEVGEISRKKCYERVRLNVISVTRGWVGVTFQGGMLRNTLCGSSVTDGAW